MCGSRASVKLLGLLTQIALVWLYTDNTDSEQPQKGSGTVRASCQGTIFIPHHILEKRHQCCLLRTHWQPLFPTIPLCNLRGPLPDKNILGKEKKTKHNTPLPLPQDIFQRPVIFACIG